MADADFDCNAQIGYGFSAYPEDVAARVDGHASAIQSDIDKLKEEAAVLAERAKNIIASVNQFTTTTIPSVEFDATISPYTWVTPNMPHAPPAYQFGGLGALTMGAPPGLKLEDFASSSFAAPDMDPMIFPDEPTLPALTAPPEAPDVAQIDIQDPPVVNVSVGNLPDVGQAPTFAHGLPELDFVDLVDPDIKLPDLPDTDLLDDILERIQAPFERNDYTQKVLPDAHTAAAALLHGNFVLDMDELEAGIVGNITRAIAQHDQRVVGLWGRRGFVTNPYAVQYSQNVADRVWGEHKKMWEAAVLRWRMRLLPEAMRLSVEAHAQTVEMEGELYDMDFEFLAAENAALHALFALTAQRMASAIAQVEVAAARYMATTARAQALVDAHLQRVANQSALGQANRGLSEGYAAEQSAQEAAGDSFIASVDAGEARVSAYEGQMEAVRAKAQALQASVAAYDAEVAEWSASLDSVRAEYRVSRARNRAQIAANRQVAALTSADTTDAERIAFTARASATEAFVRSAQLRAQIASRLGETTQVGAENAIEVLRHAIDSSAYRAQVADYAKGIDADRSEWRTKTRINSAVSAQYGRITEQVTRAAQLTQRYQEQLSEAYQQLYDAAGQADAARVAGQLSRYRGSVGLRASGAVDSSSQVSQDVAYASDVMNSQSNDCQTVWSAGRY